MSINVTVPDMGESVIEATVSRWLKQEGDAVKAGEPLVELETDKINLEVGAQQGGILQRIEKGPGETVAVGDVLAVVAAEGEAATPSQPAAERTAGGERTAGTGYPRRGASRRALFPRPSRTSSDTLPGSRARRSRKPARNACLPGF
jgi:2-oxoglutarate dehydrogenase E2 component (dihydrolipoamide succinyltransferase)